MKKKIAVMLPCRYLGGTLQGVKNIVRMLALGAEHHHDSIQIVLSVLEDAYDIEEEFRELVSIPGVYVRETTWHDYSRQQAQEIMYNVDLGKTELPYLKYSLPDDGINNFYDCDAWFVVSDRCSAPLIPMRPYSVLVYDYIQRYVDLGVEAYFDSPFIEQVRQAKNVFVTTPQTGKDAIYYCGLSKEKVQLLEMEVSLPSGTEIPESSRERNFILWISNATKHKNHYNTLNTLNTLNTYYSLWEGKLPVIVIGYNMDFFDIEKNYEKKIGKKYPYIEKCRDYIEEHPCLQQMITFHGYVSEEKKNKLLANACFLIHPALADNGTFSVVEAAYLGTPSISHDYPQMRYIDERFRLNLTFTNFCDNKEASQRLKECEIKLREKREKLPTRAFLEKYTWKNLADDFYEKVVSHL